MSETREKAEARNRLVEINAVEVSLVDRAANEREFLAIKNADGGTKPMNDETTREPQVEMTVEKALDLSKQLMTEQGEALVEHVKRMISGEVARDDRDLLWDLVHNFNSNAWVMRAAKVEKKVYSPEEYPAKKASEENVEKAGAALDMAKKLLAKATGLAGENEELKKVLSEMNELLGKMGKYPYSEKKEDAVSDVKKEEKKPEEKDAAKASEEKASEEKDAAKASEEKAPEEKAPEGEEAEAEKARKSEVVKMVEALEAQRKSIDDTLKLLKGEDAKAEGAKMPPKYEEEMKSLGEAVKKQGDSIEAMRKDLDTILKTRGASKAAEEAPPETREKADGDEFWKGIL